MYKRHVLKQLSAYLDNQLSDKQKTEIDEHINECKICAEELAKLRLVSIKLKTLPAPCLKEDFDASVRDEILRQELERGRVTMKSKPFAILVPSGVLVGILVLALVVGMQTYVKRGVQGRILSLAKVAGDRYDYSRNGLSSETSHWGDKKYAKREKIDRLAANGPVIATGSLESTKLNRQSIDGRADSKPVRAKGGYEYDASYSLIMAGPSGPTESYDQQLAYNEPVGQETSLIVIQPILPATGQGQMIIRTGDINLEVEYGQETYQKALQISQELGGFISNSSFYKDREGREAGTITMRIPKDRFDIALDKLSKLGKVEGVNSASQDVSQEYANLKAQLEAKMIVYKKMLDALKERKVTIPEAVRLENELTPIVSEIETVKNRIEYLNNQVSLTTVTLNFHEPEVSAKALRETKRIIKETVLATTINSIKFFAKAIPAALAVIFWIIVIGVVGLVIKYLVNKLFKRE